MTTQSAELQSSELQALERERVFDAYRRWGYLDANLYPFGGPIAGGFPDLRLPGEDAAEARRIYCGTIGAEFMHLPQHCQAPIRTRAASSDDLRLVADRRDTDVHAARSTRVSISLRNAAKSIGLLRRDSAPRASALRLVSASPYAVIMMTGTSGRSALAFGRSSRPVMPGMLMSDRIRISVASLALPMQSSATGAD